MTSHTDFSEAGRRSRQAPTASEYRQIADRFLDHCGMDEVGDDTLTYLAGHLYVLAVQMESRASSSRDEGGGASSAQVAPEITPPEVGHLAAPQAV